MITSSCEKIFDLVPEVLANALSLADRFFDEIFEKFCGEP